MIAKDRQKIEEGSFAVAEAVMHCKPEVVAFYPITPSTHIPEKLAEFAADGKLDAEVIMAESEFTSISACVGAVAAGSRAFTATSSQGLALMHEIIYATSGMRLPLVMSVVNRSLSAPLNIWNDWQDAIAERDSGWLQIYAESNQEAVDTMVQAFKIAEDSQVLLPVMVCMDGFWLSHTFEPVIVPESKEVSSFLPSYKSDHAFLDPERPITQGAWAGPKHYQDMRKELSDAVDASLPIVKRVHDEYAQKFGRKYGDGLVETYGHGDVVFVSMGSLCLNIKDAADKHGFGLLRVRCYRPFPSKEVAKCLENKRLVIVAEKDISLGKGCGALFEDVRNAICSAKNMPKVVNFICGLGGKDVTVKDVEAMRARADGMKDGSVEWL